MKHTGLVSIEHCNSGIKAYLAIRFLLQVMQIIDSRLDFTNNARTQVRVLAIVSGTLFIFLLSIVDTLHFLLGFKNLLKLLVVDENARIGTTGMREALFVPV